MDRNAWLKLINTVLLVSLLTQAVTGALLFLNFDSRLAGLLHTYNGLLLVALALTHLTLNWSWVRANFLKR